MKLLFLTSLILSSAGLWAKGKPDYTIIPAADGLYYLYYDSSTSKSTIVEFTDFLALIEVPIRDDGNTNNLQDHVDAGQRVLRTLKKRFPNKPLRYVLHTHWHPHSISSVTPFLAEGITLVTTHSGFDKLKDFINPKDVQRYEKNIRFVEGDSLTIQDAKNKITAYRFLKKDFPSAPTEEYLYFFLPNYSALHAGCMFFRTTQQIEGKEVVVNRILDIDKFLTTNSIQPKSFIRCNGDKTEPQGMLSFSTFRNMLDHGITTESITERYFLISDHLLREKRDSVIGAIIKNNVPVSLCNGAVYSCIRKKELSKALLLAQMQVMLNPSDANTWDTLGEVHYFLGETEIAIHYGKQAQKVNSSFTRGGEAVWKANLENYRK